MKNIIYLPVIFWGLLLVSCTKNETIINNYHYTSSIDSNWEKITDPVDVSRGHLFISQKGTIFLISGNENYKSYDNCKTWTKFPFDSMVQNYNFYEGKNNIIYNIPPYSTFGPPLSKTMDEGNTWSEVKPPEIDNTGKQSVRVYDIDIAKNGDILINMVWGIKINDTTYTNEGVIYRSTDDGATWAVVKNGNDTLKQIYGIKTGCKNNLYANQVYDNNNPAAPTQSIFSLDNGYTWKKGQKDLDVRFFITDSTGIIYYNYYVLEKNRSIDNGVNFTNNNYRFYGDIKSMAFSKNSKIFYSTTYGIYVSNDSGLNWDLLLIHSGILDIAVSPDGYLYFRDSTYILYRSKQQIAK